VDAEFSAETAMYVSALPRLKQVYIVRAVGTGRYFGDRLPGILLEGFYGRPLPLSELGEHDFLASRFRPVVERKTDISIFTRMLNDKTVEVVR